MSETLSNLDLSSTRRQFLGVVGLGALFGASTGQVMAQASQDDDPQSIDASSVCVLTGDAAELSINGGEFDPREGYNYLYITTGGTEYVSFNGSPWRQISMKLPQTQVEEVRTEDFKSFFNHTFARPGSPDDKNWEFADSEVSKDESEIELASTASMRSTQRGNYPPGTEAIPGAAWRVTGIPTAGRAEAGYFTSQDGFGGGEDPTDSYAFIRKGGSVERVYRIDWNGYVPDSRVWVSDSPVITRMPHLFYGGGAVDIRAILHEDGEPELKTLHTFTPENVPDGFGTGPPFSQPNLPIRFESSSLSGGRLRANAAHYEYGESDAENRVNGIHYGPTTVGTAGWTLLAAWRKRTGWEMVNVKPLKVGVVAETNPVKVELQLNPSLSSVTTSLPIHTSSDETSVEEVTSATVDSFGERRWVGFAPAGQGSSTDSISADDLTFNLPVNQPVGLFAQAVGGDATVSGSVAWEEFF